jgi:hypothetical protein
MNAGVLSLTPCFSWGMPKRAVNETVSTVFHIATCLAWTGKPLKRLGAQDMLHDPLLKQGVNEKDCLAHHTTFQVFILRATCLIHLCTLLP